jgi:polysaccharide biosynthesis transport protein
MNAQPDFPTRQSAYLMTVGHLLAILRGRWRSIAVPLAAALVLGAAVSLLLPKRYTASATLLIDVKSPDPVSGIALQGTTSPSYMATQIDLISSEPVARRAARELGVVDMPEFIERWRKDTGGAGDVEVWAAEQLGRDLTVAPTHESNVIQVSFNSRDAQFAKRAADAFSKAFVDTTRILRVDPAKRHKQFFDNRAEQMREELEAAQARLSDFERKNGLIGDDKAIDVETTRLVELTAQMVALQAQASETRSRRLQNQSAADAAQESLQSPLIGGLRADLQRERVKLGQLLATRGSDHPQVIEIEKSIDELKARVVEETARVSAGVAQQDRVNQRRLADLRASIDAQRSLVSGVKSLREQSVALRRDVENAQRSYDLVVGRANQMGLESQVAQTNVSIVGLASVPIKPSSPKVLLNLLAAAALGLMTGLAWALLREGRDRRIRVDDDIAALLQQPLVATLPPFGRLNGAATLGATPAAQRARRLLTAT